jgi:hypothetical protein
MLFALICTDKPDHLSLRMEVRPEHLKFLEGLGGALKAAGPFTNGEDSPVGSLIIIEAVDRAVAEFIASSDPYAKAGLFESVDIRPWKWTLKNPEAK